MTEPIYLTKKGIKEIKKQIARLERDRTDTIAQLRDSDKSEAHDSRLERIERLANLEIINSELAEKQLTLSQAKPLPRKRDALKVAIGSAVELLDTNGRIFRYTLVESLEANPSDGRISIKSPLGQSLVGKQIRDIVEWSTRTSKQPLQLIAIR